MEPLPVPYDVSEIIADRVTPERRNTYSSCPACGQLSWDALMAFCSDPACGHSEPFVCENPTPPEQVERELVAARVRMAALGSSCEVCEAVRAAIEAVYPIYCDYSGKLLGGMTSRVCVPCFRDRHPGGEACPVWGAPYSLAYV